MKKILILNGQYLPGHRGGGPIQSCLNMVNNLSDNYEFYVICSDRDHKSEIPYENIKVNEWNDVGNAKVLYMTPDRLNFKGFKEVLNNTEFDILYLNGFFSPIFTIYPLLILRLGMIEKRKVILTPRGDFTGGCESKKIKKYTYIYLSKLIGLYKNILWHTTSELENRDVLKKFPKANTFLASNLPSKFIPKINNKQKEVGKLKIIFISRIFPKKNIKYALEVLKKVNDGKIIFDIYGPMEDMIYWGECKSIIKTLPKNIKVEYKGELSHDEVGNTFNKYDVFLFPTLGENYGHVIVEAMSNNCITILSKNTTPWDDYDGNGGFVISLNDIEGFRSKIIELIRMNSFEYSKLIEKNNKYIEYKLNSTKIIKDYINMFNIN